MNNHFIFQISLWQQKIIIYEILEKKKKKTSLVGSLDTKPLIEWDLLQHFLCVSLSKIEDKWCSTKIK
jgi:hypothetical protein